MAFFAKLDYSTKTHLIGFGQNAFTKKKDFGQKQICRPVLLPRSHLQSREIKPNTIHTW
jgi:hypothetical protein